MLAPMSLPDLKVLRLTVLDDSGLIVTRGSGFVVYHSKEEAQPEGVYLYTCWHLVTGIDFFDPKVPVIPQRGKILRVDGKDFKVNDENSASHGGSFNFDIKLYDDKRNPNWQQTSLKRKFSGIEECHIFVPRQVDVVRFHIDENLGLHDLMHGWHIPVKNIRNCRSKIGEDCYIAGYPYGYSAYGDDTIQPVFLKRSYATRGNGENTILLDGFGSKGMSGGPVFERENDEYNLVGIYRGMIYPRGEQDRFAAFGIISSFKWVSHAISYRPGAAASDAILDSLLTKGED